MSHDGMPRAYLRLDPNIDQTHPDIEGFIRLLCAAHRQPDRGRFRDRQLLDRAVGKVRAARFLARGDVAVVDGRYYVTGWDEWQEGDLTVSERMRRMRLRRRDADVTAPASPGRNDVTTDAYIGDGDGDEENSPPPPVGRRKDGTNARSLGTNPRARGESPRQVRAAAKRGGGDSLGEILRRAAAAGHDS